MLAGFAGFPQEVRHAVAVLAERAADPSAYPGSWLTTRALRDLDRPARENPAALDRLIADHERVLGVDIDVSFAGLPAWRERVAARQHLEITDAELLALAARLDIWRSLLGHVSAEARTHVGQVWERLLLVELRAEFPLFPRSSGADGA